MQHRMGEIEKRRTPQEDAGRDRRVGLLVQAANRAITEFEPGLVTTPQERNPDNQPD